MDRRSLGRARGALIASGALLAGAAAAVAATPESGTVSKSSPKVEWNGQVAESYFGRLIVLNDPSAPCEAPTCDSFKLTVADSANLMLTADAPAGSTGDGQVTINVTTPDGGNQQFTGPANPEKPLKATIKNAKTGDYAIDYYNNFVGPPTSYNASAELAVAPAPAAPPPAPVPTATPAPAEGINITVTAGKQSARKIAKAKALKVKVTVSRPVASIAGTLKAGSKTVAKGALGASSGTFTLKLKPSRKLKRGSYSLTVVASDGKGVTATRTVKVKLAK